MTKLLQFLQAWPEEANFLPICVLLSLYAVLMDFLIPKLPLKEKETRSKRRLQEVLQSKMHRCGTQLENSGRKTVWGVTLNLEAVIFKLMGEKDQNKCVNFFNPERKETNSCGDVGNVSWSLPGVKIAYLNNSSFICASNLNPKCDTWPHCVLLRLWHAAVQGLTCCTRWLRETGYCRTTCERLPLQTLTCTQPRREKFSVYKQLF